MNASQTQIRAHRYMSGWCEAARHDRCKGSYAGTACNCSCHRLVGPERSAEGNTAPFPRAGHDAMSGVPVAPEAEHPGGTGASGGQMPRDP
jgi:hypothetical protein